MTQIVKVATEDYDGDDFGNEWQVFYWLTAETDDAGLPCFMLWEGDDRGNGNRIATGYNENRMVSLTLKLGRWVEWKAAA